MSQSIGVLHTTLDDTISTNGLSLDFTDHGRIHSRTTGMVTDVSAYTLSTPPIRNRADESYTLAIGTQLSIPSGVSYLVPFTGQYKPPTSVGISVDSGWLTTCRTSLVILEANVRFLANGYNGMRQVWFQSYDGIPFGVNRMTMGGYGGHLVISTVGMISTSTSFTFGLFVGHDAGQPVILDAQDYCPKVTVWCVNTY